jgi:hypothetical protein
VKILLGLLLMLVLVRIWNAPDEAPSASALRWAEPWRNVVPDARNAWLMLVGLGAAEGEDPIALGRRRVDAYEERVRLGPDAARDAALKALYEDEVPTPPDDYATRFVFSGCPHRDVDCIEWARWLQEQLEAMQVASALRLERYDAALAMADYEESIASFELDVMPGWGGSTPTLHLDLIARDIATGTPADQALDRLLRVASFWRRAGEQGRSLASKFLSLAMLERCWRIADALIDRLDASELRALKPRLDALLAAPSRQQRDLSPEMRYLSHRIERELREKFSARRMLRDCLGQDVVRCAHTGIIAQGYSPRATFNLIAATFDAVDRLQAAAPDDYEKAFEDFEQALRTLHPIFFDDLLKSVLARNPTGRVIAAIAVPDLRWIERRNDVEVLRRLFALKLQARLASIGHGGMRAFLAAQPPTLQDAYREAAFAWDDSLQEISFVPDSNYWQRPRLAVSMRRPAADGIIDCTHPVRVRFRRRLSDTDTTDLAEALGCGRVGSFEALHPGGAEDAPDDDVPDLWESFHDILIAADSDAVQVVLAWRGPDERLLGYDALDLPLDGEYRDMRALGHDDGALLEASAEPAPEVSLLRVRLRNQPIGTLVRGLQTTKHISVLGLGAACLAQPITVDFSAVALDEILAIIGDECNLQPRMTEPRVYRFAAFASETESALKGQR